MSDGSDPVDALEQRVAELEATVRGLTEELVDATERVRQLERETGVAEPSDSGRARRERAANSPSEPDDDVESSAEDDTPKKADTEDSPDSEESPSDDIIVA